MKGKSKIFKFVRIIIKMEKYILIIFINFNDFLISNSYISKKRKIKLKKVQKSNIHNIIFVKMRKNEIVQKNKVKYYCDKNILLISFVELKYFSLYF